MTKGTKNGNYLRKIWVEEVLKERGKENGKWPENRRYWDFSVKANTDDQRYKKRKLWVEELLEERGKENGKWPENGRYWEFRVEANTDDQRNKKRKIFTENMSRGTTKG